LKLTLQRSSCLARCRAAHPGHPKNKTKTSSPIPETVPRLVPPNRAPIRMQSSKTVSSTHIHHRSTLRAQRPQNGITHFCDPGPALETCLYPNPSSEELNLLNELKPPTPVRVGPPSSPQPSVPQTPNRQTRGSGSSGRTTRDLFDSEFSHPQRPPRGHSG
jgi:hypothetical protein